MLGNKVKVLRGKLDLSRKELAEDLNISYQTLSKYETNEREPNIDTLKKLADYFNVSIDELVNRNTDLDSLHPKTKNECAVPVYTRLFPGIEATPSSEAAYFESILLPSEAQRKKYLFYIANDMSLQNYRILRNDKMLFKLTEHMEQSGIALLQIAQSLPMIRMVYRYDSFFMIMENSIKEKPKIFSFEEAAEQIQFIAQLKKVEFLPDFAKIDEHPTING